MAHKRAKLDDTVSQMIIGTHSGSFQADEAMAVWMLRQTPEYRRAKCVRSRDMKVLEKLDILVDVGGVYDHCKKRYDHHQRDYDERFDGRTTKLSACGLIYRHYGKDVIQAYCPSLTGKGLDFVYQKIYWSLLEAVDAIDNGVAMAPDGVIFRYRDMTGLSSRVARLNPHWNEVDGNGNPIDMDERFEVASRLCGEDFMSVLTKLVENDMSGREIVEKAILERSTVDPSGEIIMLHSAGLPWNNYLYFFERKFSLDPLIKFVLSKNEEGMWRVHAVRVEKVPFHLVFRKNGGVLKIPTLCRLRRFRVVVSSMLEDLLPGMTPLKVPSK